MRVDLCFEKGELGSHFIFFQLFALLLIFLPLLYHSYTGADTKYQCYNGDADSIKASPTAFARPGMAGSMRRFVYPMFMKSCIHQLVQVEPVVYLPGQENNTRYKDGNQQEIISRSVFEQEIGNEYGRVDIISDHQHT